MQTTLVSAKSGDTSPDEADLMERVFVMGRWRAKGIDVPDHGTVIAAVDDVLDRMYHLELRCRELEDAKV